MKDQMKKTVYALFPFIGLVFVLAVFFILLLSFKDSETAMKFISLGNMRSMLTKTVIVGIGALGMTLVIISGGIDLSVGSMLALGSVCLAAFLVSSTTYYVKDTSADTKYDLMHVIKSQKEKNIDLLKDRLQLEKDASLDDIKEKLVINSRDIPSKFKYAEFKTPEGKEVSKWSIERNVSTTSVITSVFVAMGVCALCGFLNGAISVGFGIVPFIVTLGMMQIARGFAQIFAGSKTVSPPSNFLNSYTNVEPASSWMVVSQGVWIMIILTIALTLVLKYTVFGRYVYAIGSNENTAKLCGIAVTKTRIIIYTLCGAFTGLAAVMQYAKSGSGLPNSGVAAELDIIAAVVIGGGSLNGGEGSAIGSLAGALVMSVLRSGCTFLQVPDPWQNVIIGSIIIIAVGIDKLKHRKTA